MTSGSSGDEITLSGAGFGTEVSAVTVIIGGVVCDTTAVTDAEVKCNLGLREGGVADVQVRSSFALQNQLKVVKG